MGASNSKPQIVQMSNTSPYQISRDVLERVEKASASAPAAVIDTKPTENTFVCEQCDRNVTAEKISQPLTGVVSTSWTRRSTEIEELQFSKTLDRVHHLFGQPVKWAKANECSADIEGMERQLIACYREYGSEPLKCAQLASQYTTFVFDKQVAAVKNTNFPNGGVQLKESQATASADGK